MSDFLWPHGLQCLRLPCPSLFHSLCLLRLRSVESVILCNHLTLFCPLLSSCSSFVCFPFVGGVVLKKMLEGWHTVQKEHRWYFFLFLFFFSVTTLCGLWHTTGDWTWVPGCQSTVLTTRLPGNSLNFLIY